VLIDRDCDQHPLIPEAFLAAPAELESLLNLLDAGGEVRPLEDIEAQAIRFALSHYRGQMSEAARRLKIGRSTLYRKLDINNMMAGHENA
jgi:DNA-binding NtrC family response regulator